MAQLVHTEGGRKAKVTVGNKLSVLWSQPRRPLQPESGGRLGVKVVWEEEPKRRPAEVQGNCPEGQGRGLEFILKRWGDTGRTCHREVGSCGIAKTLSQLLWIGVM